MPESKHMKWDQGFGTDAEQDPKVKDTTVAANEPAANDADGWQQYRRWISKAPAPRGRRVGIAGNRRRFCFRGCANAWSGNRDPGRQ